MFVSSNEYRNNVGIELMIFEAPESHVSISFTFIRKLKHRDEVRGGKMK